MKLNIAVDVDGVLFDHIPYVLRAFRDNLGIDMDRDDLRAWDFFHLHAIQEADLTWGEVRRVLDAVESDWVLHEEEPLDPLAANVMADWIARGHTVDVVTARAPKHEHVTKVFLNHHGIPHHALRMGVALKTGYDVLIDDAPHNVLLAAADGTKAFLYDHPYNRDVPTHTNPVRVHDWHDVDDRVQELTEQLPMLRQ